MKLWQTIKEFVKKERFLLRWAIIIAVCLSLSLSAMWLNFAYPAGTQWFLVDNRTGRLIASILIDIAPELMSIVFTILIIDRLNEQRQEKLRLQVEAEQKKREQENFKTQLTRDLTGHSREFAVRAVNELREYGWLDEVLIEVKERLYERNLSGADLRLI